MLAEKFNARLIQEQFFENPFLPKFYENPDKFSFPLELSFLAERYHQLNEELKNIDLFRPMTIADYYLMKSLIFSRANLSEDEFRLYRQIFDIIFANTVKPDLYVYLYLSIDKLMRNIRNRGRFFEQKIHKDYLVKLQDGYMDFFKKQTDLTILMIDINELDFYHNHYDFERIVSVIFDRSYSPGINKVIP